MPEETPPDVIRMKGLSLTIPKTALVLMLVGILGPPTLYSTRLNNPNPTQLITAISVSLFASVLYLWILDATSLLRFRSPWVSGSVYGIGISAILAATVGIYKDSFTKHLHPFDGLWLVSAWDGKGHRIADNHELILYLNRSANTYSGYSSYVTPHLKAAGTIEHLRVERFDPESKLLIMTVLRRIPPSVGLRVSEVDADPTRDNFQMGDGKVDANSATFEFVHGTPDTSGSIRYVFTRP